MLKLLTRKFDINKLNFVFNINPVFGKQFIVSSFFFFALMPYVSPIPLGSDVQIMTGLIGYAVLIALLLKDKFTVDKRELVILLTCLIFIFYININEPTYQFRKAIGPLYSFSVFYIAKRYNSYFNIKILSGVIIIYLAGAVTQYISPGLFNQTFEHFIRVAKYSATTGRGVTSLSPEPSFLGIVCIFILIIQDWFYIDSTKDRSYYYRLAACIFMILLSKSGGGYVLLFLYFASKTTVYLKHYWYIIVIVAITGIAVVSNIEIKAGNKGLSDLIGVLRSTSPKDLLRVSSFSNRVNPIIVGLYGAYEKPLGRGSGSFTTEAKEVYLENDIDEIYPSYLRDRLLYEISIDSVSSFGKYLFEYGLIFIFYLILILSGLDFKRAGPFTVFLVLIGLLFSLPIVYPPIWIIYGVFDRKVVAKKRDLDKIH